MTVRGPPVSKQNQVSAQYKVLGGFRAQEVRPFFVAKFGVLRVYRHSLFVRPSGGAIVLFLVFTGILFSERPPVAPSFFV